MTVGELFADYDKADGRFNIHFTQNNIGMTGEIPIRKIPEFWKDKKVINWTTTEVGGIWVEVEL